MATILTKTQVPFTGPYSVAGLGRHRGNTPLALKSAMARLGFLPWEPDKWDDVFNNKLEAALDEWDAGKSGYAEGRWLKLRAAKVKSGPHAGEWALDASSQLLIRQEYASRKKTIPNLGPLYHGGMTVLLHDLTHDTDGLPRLANGTSLWPAFDDAFAVGTSIIACENMTVYKTSSSVPGNAFYARGASKIRYWFGHLDRTNYVGKSFQRGDLIGRVAVNHVSVAHCHAALNIEELVGVGKYLAHHANYTHGAPLIGAQLEAMLNV